MIWLAALAGGVGAVARFLADSWLRSRELRVPATVLINVVGSALLGWLVGAHASGVVSATWVTLAGTGFCGGFTTLSTAMVEVVRDLRERAVARGLAWLLGGLALCLAAAALGYLAGS